MDGERGANDSYLCHELMYMSRTHIGFTVVREGKLKSTFVGMCIWEEEEKERGRERERDGEREGQRN